MKKLFTGKFGRIPVAVLLTVLLAVIVAGGVVAATSGYTLWSGTVDITVNEPITIHHGPSSTNCPYLLTMDSVLSHTVPAGDCAARWFKFASLATNDLLLKADVLVSDETVMTVNYYDAIGDPLDLDGDGMLINSTDGDVYVEQRICVDGAADPEGVYDATVTFTRESPPLIP